MLVTDGGTENIPASVPGDDLSFSYTIVNLGNADLTLSTPISVTGSSNCSVSVNTQPASTVAPAATTDPALTITPTTTGAWSATLSIANNDPDENPYFPESVPLQGGQQSAQPKFFRVGLTLN